MSKEDHALVKMIPRELQDFDALKALYQMLGFDVVVNTSEAFTRPPSWYVIVLLDDSSKVIQAKTTLHKSPVIVTLDHINQFQLLLPLIFGTKFYSAERDDPRGAFGCGPNRKLVIDSNPFFGSLPKSREEMLVRYDLAGGKSARA